MRIVWVTRSFLDYRIPVYAELDRLTGGGLNLLYLGDAVPDRVRRKAQDCLGARAVALTGEWRIGPANLAGGMANQRVRLVYQPGLIREIRRRSPDVIVGDGFFQWTSAAMWVRLTEGTPLVVCYERTAHTERRAAWFRSAYRRMAARFIGAMCCNGRLSLEYACRLGMPRSRITTGQMAADTDNLGRQAGAVTARRRQEIRQSWNAQGVLFLYVGRITTLKGIACLLDAWGLLERAMPGQATLLLVGTGDEEAALREQARRLGLAAVRFLGEIDYDELAPCYASADAFVIPTLEDNWSLVVPEAMACGLPILCSKYNGCWPELVQEGRNGWVFDPLNVQDLFQCLRRCIDAKDRLKAMGEQSRVIVRDHTPARAAQSIFEACQIAVTRRTGGRCHPSDLNGGANRQRRDSATS